MYKFFSFSYINAFIAMLFCALPSFAHHKDTHKPPPPPPRKPVPISDLLTAAAAGANAQEIARIIDQNPVAFAELIRQLTLLPQSQISGSVAQLSGELNLSSSLGGVTQGNRFLALLAHGRQNRVLIRGATRHMNANGKEIHVGGEPELYAWTNISASSLNQNGSTALGNANSSVKPFGIAYGMEYVFDRTKMLGFALYGGGSSYTASGLGTGTGQNALLSFYGRYGFGNNYSLAGSLIGGVQQSESQRSISILALTENLGAKGSSHSIGGRFELSRAFYTSFATTTPFIAAQFNSVYNKSYSEYGVGGSTQTLALAYQAATQHSYRAEIGVSFDKTFDGVHRISTRIGYGHEFAGSPSQTAAFLIAPNTPFTIQGSAPAKDMLLLSIGGDYRYSKRISLYGNFGAEIAPTTKSFAGQAGLKWNW